MDIPPDILVEKTPERHHPKPIHGVEPWIHSQMHLSIRPDLVRNILHQLQLLLNIFLGNLISAAVIQRHKPHCLQCGKQIRIEGKYRYVSFADPQGF